MSTFSDRGVPVMLADPAGPLDELSSVLERVECELSALATLGEDVQDAVSRALKSVSLADRDLVALQTLDSLTQHLAGLSCFVRNLARQAPESWKVDPHSAARVVSVASLARRLSPSAAMPDPAEAESEEWFLAAEPTANAA